MGMNLILFGVIVYLVAGIICLITFDLITKRIRSKFTQATGETQLRLAAAGNYTGGKMAACLFTGALWLFWPMVFIGALTDKIAKKESKNGS